MTLFQDMVEVSFRLLIIVWQRLMYEQPWNDGRHTMYVLQLHAHMMHDFYCEIFNDAANDASAASHADAFNQT